jgi:hypothetical protein
MSCDVPAPVTDAPSFNVRGLGRGRALATAPDGAVYVAQGPTISRTYDDGRTWQDCAKVSLSPARRLIGMSRLASRLLRQEFRALGVFAKSGLVAAGRQGVYFYTRDEGQFRPSRIAAGTQRVSTPLTITVGPNDRALWSEYNSNPYHGNPVRVFVSDDGGKNFDVGYVFEANDIKHVHNFVFDAALGKYWVLAGDWEHEPGIGLLSEDLKTCEWLRRGEQKYRTVDVFDFGDRLVYGMDSDLEPNAVFSMDKATGNVRRLCELEGSCIYSCRCGPWYVISTTVEPSKVNRSRHAALYLSRDGEKWRRVYRVEKDRWDDRYFQYGSLILPRGQSLRGIDGRLFATDLDRFAGQF